jgi:hypothetical protein
VCEVVTGLARRRLDDGVLVLLVDQRPGHQVERHADNEGEPRDDHVERPRRVDEAGHTDHDEQIPEEREEQLVVDLGETGHLLPRVHLALGDVVADAHGHSKRQHNPVNRVVGTQVDTVVHLVNEGERGQNGRGEQHVGLEGHELVLAADEATLDHRPHDELDHQRRDEQSDDERPDGVSVDQPLPRPGVPSLSDGFTAASSQIRTGTFRPAQVGDETKLIILY